MSIHCGIAFQTADEFRAAFVTRGATCFVPYPDEVAIGEILEVDVTVGDARLEVRGQVVAADFDEAGNVGLAIALDDASRAAMAQFDAGLQSGQAPDLFVTTQTRLGAALPPVVSRPSPVPTEEQARLAPGTVVDGRFRVDAYLATGGMGEVYRAEHVLLKRPVALKLLRRSLSRDPDMWERFEREAQLVSQLENPHVVRVFDFGRTSDGQPFIAMEFVDGEPLDRRLLRGPLAPAEAVELLAQVLDGLAEAHGLGVVHRDLKPANIMLGHRRDGGERAKILDFGIARLSDQAGADQKLTQMGVIVGTPAYLAPEQALADELDHRTDIYALGCVAYELLTGRPPFVGDDLRKVISQHLTAAPTPLQKVRPELAQWPALCAAVTRAMAKEKENRFQNVGEFGEALRRGLEVAGAPAPPLQQLVPTPSAPWPPAAPEWQEAPPPASSPSAIAMHGALADDFFTSMGSTPFAAMPAPAGAGAAPVAASPFRGLVPEQVLTALQPPSEPASGLVVRVEVMGPPARSEAERACLARVLEAMADAQAFVAGQDDEGVSFGFVGRGGSPAGRAVHAMLAARDAVLHHAALQKLTASIRALCVTAELPLAAATSESMRVQLARGRANSLWLERALAPGAGRLCELLVTDAPGLVACGPSKRRPRVATELLGRRALVDGFERRLHSLAQGVVAPLLVTGPEGSGHTTLAALLVASAKKRGALALATSPLDEPFGAASSLLCAALGLDVGERLRRLASALEALPLVDPVRQAALVVAGVRPQPGAMTAGQAAHALRAVLRAVALDRPVVLAFDGLHAMDAASVEVFALMAARPASKELVVGFTAPSPHDAKLAGVPVAALPPLSPAEVQRLASVALGGVAGPALTAFLVERSDGVPGAALELLAWLDDAGLLAEAGGTLELLEPELEPSGEPRRLAFKALPRVQQHVLQLAALLGERFSWSVLRDAAAVPGEAISALAGSWLLADGPKRGHFRSPSLRPLIPALPDDVAKAARLRCANALIAQGQAEPTSVDPVSVAQQLTAAGDAARALPLWKHALEQSLARHDARLAGVCWEGVAAALGAMPVSEPQTRTRVEALARAAALALLGEDAARARALLDAARRFAETLPAPVVELLLVEARVLRLEGRRVKAAEVLASAEPLAGLPVLALVLAERGEAREVEGDLDGSLQAFELAHRGAPAAAEVARWHGEIEFTGRIEARLATICFARRDAGRARALLEASLARWRAVGWPYAEARVLSTLGTVLAFSQRFQEAASSYAEAAQAGARCGDLLFQARALLQQAKALRKLQGDSAAMRAVALEARKLSIALSWEQGRLDASALVGQ
ncbi:MAG: protein kinase domain-containing protein [Myxococcota bacterium]